MSSQSRWEDRTFVTIFVPSRIADMILTHCVVLAAQCSLTYHNARCLLHSLFYIICLVLTLFKSVD